MHKVSCDLKCDLLVYHVEGATMFFGRSPVVEQERNDLTDHEMVQLKARIPRQRCLYDDINAKVKNLKSTINGV